MRLKYPAEVEEYIRANVKGVSAKDLAEMVTENTGYPMTAEQIRSYKKNHKLKSGGVRGQIGDSKYPKGMREYVREIAPGRSNEETARLVNEKFGEGTVTREQIVAYKKNHHISSGLTGQFQKGQASWTKGRPMSEWMSPEGIASCSRTMFKKGGKPATEKPIGSITKSSDGYLWIKVSDKSHIQRENWRQLHRVVWEENHGPVPDGTNIIFLDGNRENVSIENLAAVTKAEHLEMVRDGLRFTESELTESGIALAKLRVAAKAKKKNAHNTKEQR